MAAAPGGVRQRTTHAHGVESPEPRAPSPRARQMEPRAPEHARRRQTLRRKIKTGRGHQGGLPGGGGVFWARGTPAWGRSHGQGPRGTAPPPGCAAAPRVPAGPAAAARHLHQPPPTGRVRGGTTGEQDPQGPVLLLGFSERAAPSPLPPTSGAGGALQLSSSSVPRPTPQRVPGHNRVSPSPSGCPSPRPPSRCLVTCGS